MLFRQTTMRARLALTFGVVVALVLLVSGLALGDANDGLASHGARTALIGQVRAAAIRRAIAVRNLVRVTKPDDIEVERVAMTRSHGDANARPGRLNGAIAANSDVTEKNRSLVAEIKRIEARDSLVALSIADAALHDQREQAIVGIDSVSPSPATDRARRPNRCPCRSIGGTSQSTRTSEPDATRPFNCLQFPRASCIYGLVATQ